MASFKKTIIPVYSSARVTSTPDTLYWKKLGFPFTVKENAAITHIDFSPVEPHYFAASSSTRVQVYNPISNQVYRNLARFKVEAFGGTFRQDGKLLAAGDADGIVRVFEVASKNVLRFMRGHNGSVHKCMFLKDNVHLASFSDDKTVGIWDVPGERKVLEFSDHKDYIRAGATSHVSPDIVFSGSYDHTVKMYDCRTANCVLSVNHESPVEAILLFPSSGLFLSAGSVDIKVWDALAGGRLLAKITQHHKTVTSLCFASDFKRLASASLDSHVKMYDVGTYQTVHTMKFPSPILSFGISADDNTLAVGMSDGLLSVQQRQKAIKTDSTESTESRGRKKKMSYKYLLEAKSYKPMENDIVVGSKFKKKLASYDKLLKGFESTKALDVVLQNYKKGEKPEIVLAVLQELIRRGAINSAIAGRTPRHLALLLHFIIKNIRDHRFMRTLADIVNILLDVYPVEMAELPQVKKKFKLLLSKVKAEEHYMKEVTSLKGTIEILLAAANCSRTSTNDTSLQDQLLIPTTNEQT